MAQGNSQEIRELITKCTFSYTRQIEIKGLGQAILTGETLVGNEPFGVILADDLCVGDGAGVLSQMVRVFEKHNCSVVAIQEIDPKESYKYGIVQGKKEADGSMVIENMVEKPDPKDAPSNLAIIGRYILTPNIFDILRRTRPGKGGEIQITDALLALSKSEKVLGYEFQGKRFDCGGIEGFVEATNFFYQKRTN